MRRFAAAAEARDASVGMVAGVDGFVPISHRGGRWFCTLFFIKVPDAKRERRASPILSFIIRYDLHCELSPNNLLYGQGASPILKTGITCEIISCIDDDDLFMGPTLILDLIASVQ